MDAEKPPTLTERKRAAILRAAAESFRHEGFVATNTDRIAERAGVSKRTLYNHFPSKDALFDAVFEGYWARLLTLSQPLQSSTQGIEERLLAFARERLAVLLDPEVLGIFRAVMAESMRAPELARAWRRDASYEELLGISTLLEEETARGRLQVQNQELAAAHLWGLVFGGLFWSGVMHVHGHVSPTYRDQVAREGVRTFLARYGAADPPAASAGRNRKAGANKPAKGTST